MESETSLGATSVDSSQTQRTTNCRNVTSNNDRVILLAILELDGGGADHTFVTKLRIRASEVTVAKDLRFRPEDDSYCSSDSSTSSSGLVYTAHELRAKIQRHFAAAQSPITIPYGTQFPSEFQVYIFDPVIRDYVPLPLDDCNIVEHFGSRWRIRLTEDASRSATSDKHLAIQGRFFEFDGSLTIAREHRLEFTESPNLQSTGTGFSIWDGTLLLSRLLERAPALVEGQRVLELGAGCGVSGVVAAALGASHVTLTDLPAVVPNLQSNIDRNREAVRRAANGTNGNNVTISCRPCDWCNPPRDILAKCADGGPPFDVILVADCVWMEHLVTPLLNMLKLLTDEERETEINDITREAVVGCIETIHEGHTMEDLIMFDQFANQSISHMDFTAQDDDSPVNSWADIYKSHHRSSGSCSMRDVDEEVSHCVLHEPPPDNSFRGFDSIHLETTTDAPRQNDRMVSSSCFPGTAEDLEDDCTVLVGHTASPQKPAVPRYPQFAASSWRPNCPSVLIAYQRRGKATHDAFRKGLHELFSHVEVLNPPNFDKPDLFFLLLCQR